jgi:TonB family protein
MVILRPIYSAYGAFELKSKYQTNFLKAMITVTTFIALLLSIFHFSSNLWEEEIRTINTKLLRLTTINIDPPSEIIIITTKLRVAISEGSRPAVGIPEPVADSLIYEGSFLEGQDEQTQNNQILDLPADNLNDGLKDLDGNYIPKRRGFMSFEILPELIYYEAPEYPKMAQASGTEGTVWVEALIDITGDVIDARIAESSSLEYFDSSAVKAAYKNKFKPAIQNGIPFKVWVKYKVEFKQMTKQFIEDYIKALQTEEEQQP